MTTNTNTRHGGFTLIELTLVMAFMSMLLLAILYLTIYAGKLYTKGTTNKTMNQISRDVTDLMKRDFLTADASLVKTPAAAGTGDLVSGRVCTGAVSYVWNTAPLLNSTSPKIMDDSNHPITFRRVIDSTAALCTQDAITGLYPMQIPATMQSTELLSTNGRDFAVYTITIGATVPPDSTGKGLYGVDLVLGTNEQGTTQKDASSGFQCRPPTDNSANFDYCTVEELQTILRTGGKN